MINRIVLFLLSVSGLILSQGTTDLGGISGNIFNLNLPDDRYGSRITEYNIYANGGINISEKFFVFSGIDIHMIHIPKTGNKIKPVISAGIKYNFYRHNFIVSGALDDIKSSNYKQKYILFLKGEYLRSDNNKFFYGLFYKQEAVNKIVFPLVGGDLQLTDNISLTGLLPIDFKLNYNINKNSGTGLKSEWLLDSYYYENFLFYNERITVSFFYYRMIAGNIKSEFQVGKTVWSDIYFSEKTTGKITNKERKSVYIKLNISYQISI